MNWLRIAGVKSGRNLERAGRSLGAVWREGKHWKAALNTTRTTFGWEGTEGTWPTRKAAMRALEYIAQAQP